MQITFPCPVCRLELATELDTGRQFRCPACQTLVSVPAQAEAATGVTVLPEMRSDLTSTLAPQSAPMRAPQVQGETLHGLHALD